MKRKKNINGLTTTHISDYVQKKAEISFDSSVRTF